MDGPPAAGKAVGYTVGGAAAASLVVLFVAMLALGADLTQWAEWEGRLVGVAGTIAGVTGAVVGLRFAMRKDPRRVK
jgi:hypothetical protein